MFRFRPAVTGLAATVVWLAIVPLAAARTETETVRAAEEVLQQFLELKVKQIPESLLAEAQGVAIIPNVIKVGLVLGGQRGKGLVIVREPDGSWRAPLFVTLTGGSIGWQVGAQSTDIVLVFKTPKSVAGLLRGKFTLGADAAVAAGPVGRRAGAATDVELKAEIYSYSRSRGLFAGISLDGSALQVDDLANATYYGTVGPDGAPVPPPAEALRLVQLVATHTANPGGVITATPAAEGPLPTLAAPQPIANPDADALRAELARAATALSPLLDETWRGYLALPAEVFQGGRHAAPETLQTALKKFDAVAKSSQYRALSDHAEFQTTHSLLQAYASALAPESRTQLPLPPPPGR